MSCRVIFVRVSEKKTRNLRIVSDAQRERSSQDEVSAVVVWKGKKSDAAPTDHNALSVSREAKWSRLTASAAGPCTFLFGSTGRSCCRTIGPTKAGRAP